MAIIVNTISDKYFSLNGHPYAKIYQPLAQGLTEIGLYSIYDTRKQIQASTPFGEYVIDGSSYGTQALTIQALLDVVYKEAEGGGGGVVTDEKVKASATDLTPNNLLAKISAGNEVSFETLNPGGNEQIKINAAKRPASRVIDDFSAVPYINYQVNTNAKAIAGLLPTVTAGDERRYFFTLETDVNELTLSVNGGQNIGENATLILSGLKAHVELAANGQDGYYIVSNTDASAGSYPLPEITAGDGGKKVTVKETEDGYELSPSTTSSGFYDIADSAILFDGVNFTLQGTFKIVTANGKEFELTDPTIAIDYTGDPTIILVNFDNSGVLQQYNDYNRQQIYDLSLTTLPVGAILYNPINTPPITFVGDYRKLRSSNKLWVKNLFDKQIYALRGIDVFGLTIGDGSLNAHVQFGLTAGDLLLVDRRYDVPTRNEIDTWNVGYFNGSLKARGVPANPYLLLTDVDLGLGSTGRALYNNNGAPLAAASGDFVWYFVVITNDIANVDRTLSYMGNESYGNQVSARSALSNEVATLENRLPIRQGAAIRYGVLLETKTTFANATKSRIIEVLAIEGEATGSPTVTTPAELVNGSDASSLHNHNSIYLNKTNTESFTPSADYHPATKKYVDDNAGGTVIDYENIFFENLSPDFAVIVRGFDFKINTITTYGGNVTVKDSSGVDYVAGATVTAGDYLKVYGDTVNMRAVIIIDEVTV